MHLVRLCRGESWQRKWPVPEASWVAKGRSYICAICAMKWASLIPPIQPISIIRMPAACFSRICLKIARPHSDSEIATGIGVFLATSANPSILSRLLNGSSIHNGRISCNASAIRIAACAYQPPVQLDRQIHLCSHSLPDLAERL